MPISHSIDVKRNVVITKMQGVVTDEESYANMQAITENQDFVPERNHIIDMIEVIESQISTERIEECANDTPFAANSTRVFVAKEQKELNLANLYIWLTKNKLEHFHVVATLDEANLIINKEPCERLKSIPGTIDSL